ncbi:MAG: glycosyl transferase [Gammaproteobacteria bacterium RIFCSPLOWO2_02_FULL_61_13]|nr:MAG: glycosyl transferase [Gammaproteobacteria bacterium RIFCSPLOWO2_02_FULL_61_13]
MDPLWLVVPGCAIWSAILLLPWRPWSTQPSFDAQVPPAAPDLRDVTVLIPARNEQAGIGKTLRSLANQGQNLRIVLVDDQSTDGTAEAARQCGLPGLSIISGDALPPGWTGKLWAQEQGLRHIESRLVLQLDADIELLPGTIAGLRELMESGNLGLVSLMARLSMDGPWERALMPAFVYFFRLLYPFKLSNSRSRLVAAAAGGCILIRTDILREMGGFGALKGELIDDCTLARMVKKLGHRTWVGLTHSAISHRPYRELGSVWEMVARTAFTQLRHSALLLLFCTVIMLAAFVLPVSALGQSGTTQIVGVVTLALMAMSYIPTLRYYDIPLIWSLTLPLAGVLYLLMTWTSAWRQWVGAGARWKERSYSKLEPHV